MKGVIILLGSVMFATGTHAAQLTTGSIMDGFAISADFQTIAGSQADGGAEIKKDDTKGIAQSFIATEDCTVEAISILAQRLAADTDFGLDIYELFDGDGSSPRANPDKVRIGNSEWAVPIAVFTLNSPDGISRGDRGDNVFTVSLEPEERFALKSGHAYAIHIYSKAKNQSDDRLILWDYAGSDVYADGTYGVPGWPVAARDLGVAFTVVEVPKSLGFIVSL